MRYHVNGMGLGRKRGWTYSEFAFWTVLVFNWTWSSLTVSFCALSFPLHVTGGSSWRRLCNLIACIVQPSSHRMLKSNMVQLMYKYSYRGLFIGISIVWSSIVRNDRERGVVVSYTSVSYVFLVRCRSNPLAALH